ncbi:hypothetical protein [Aggregatibacter actinomycetemcomitans]|uniref:hypothetical protein n=1 Tax=Aggregatibacter actinomycetemcomitans TaxID=714 RepID=UPI001652A75B
MTLLNYFQDLDTLHINTSTHQHINTSTHQHINTSTHQHRNTPILFPMPMTKVRWKIQENFTIILWC